MSAQTALLLAIVVLTVAELAAVVVVYLKAPTQAQLPAIAVLVGIVGRLVTVLVSQYTHGRSSPASSSPAPPPDHHMSGNP